MHVLVYVIISMETSDAVMNPPFVTGISRWYEML